MVYMEKKIIIIGLHVGIESVSENITSIVQKCDLLIGGKKQLEQFDFFNGKTILITGKIKELLKKIKDKLNMGLNIQI